MNSLKEPKMKGKLKESIFQPNSNDPNFKKALKNLADKYDNIKGIMIPNLEGFHGVIHGSTSYFRFALADEYGEITKEKIRPINPREFQIASYYNFLFDKKLDNKKVEFYEDLGLIVFPEEPKTDEVTSIVFNRNLWSHIREEVIKSYSKDKVNLEKPFAVTGDLDVIIDSSYDDKIRLDFNGSTEVYNIPILHEALLFKGKELRYNSEDLELYKSGFPSKPNENGDKILRTAHSGVRRLGVISHLNIYCDSDILDISTPIGKTHFIRNPEELKLDEIAKEIKFS